MSGDVDFSFLDLLFAIIISWILVTLWQRFVDNALYGSFGLDQKSTYQSLIIAVGMTIVFIAFIHLFHKMISHASPDGVLGEMESIPVDDHEDDDK